MARTNLISYALLAGLLPVLGCGGGKAKIVSAAKMQAVHKVAIVGVCTARTFNGVAGTSTMFNASWGEAVLPHEAAGFEGALPGVWRGVEIMPLSAVANTESLPTGSGGHLCFGNIDPLTEKEKPDIALMKQLATALNVDAVLAVWSAPAVKSGGSKAYMYTGMGGAAYAYLVDKNGELVMKASLKGVDSAEVEKLFSVGFVSTDIRDLRPDEYQILGTSFGKAMATALGKSVSGT